MAFTFVDLFAGIGGFRLAFEQLGGKCLGFAEIDKSAIQIYKQNFATSTEIEFKNILDITCLPSNIDVLLAGIPCQPWSVAGSLQRFKDKRGVLWFDVIRLISNSKPKTFIIENVPGLVLPSNRQNFEFLIDSLRNCGYLVSWEIINAYDYGVPQDRKRVFIVGIREDVGDRPYKFPQPPNLTPRLIDIFDPGEIKSVAESEIDFFTFSDVRGETTTIHSWDIVETTPTEKAICACLKKLRRNQDNGEKDGHPVSFEAIYKSVPGVSKADLNNLIAKNIIKLIDSRYDFVNTKNMIGIDGVYKIILPNAKYWPTLTATKSKIFIAKASVYPSTKQKFLEEIYFTGKYMPLETKHFKRLQGFPDNFICHPNPAIAQRHLGNSVAIPVVKEILQELIKDNIV